MMITTDFSKNFQGKVVLHLFMFLLVFFSNDTVMFGTNRNQLYGQIGFILEAIILAGLIAFSPRTSQYQIKENRNTTIIFFGMIICILASALFNRDFRGGYIIAILILIVSYIISGILSIELFCAAYVNLFKFIASCSVIGKLITDVFPFLRRLGLTVENSSGLLFKNYIFYARSTEPGAAARNFSLFREPGVFQAYLLVALIIAVFSFEKKRRKSDIIGIVMIVIATLLTMSTTAYIGLFLVFLLYIIHYGIMKNPNKMAIFVTVVTAISGLVIVYLCFFASDIVITNLKYIFIDKFDRSSAAFSSGASRLASIKTNMALWLRNPVFGVGITNKNTLYADIALSTYGFKTGSDTNTLLAQFSLFGTGIGIVWVIAVVALSKRLGIKRSEKIIICILIMILLMTEYLVFSILCNAWIWYGIRLAFDKQDSMSYNKLEYELW